MEKRIAMAMGANGMRIVHLVAGVVEGMMTKILMQIACAVYAIEKLTMEKVNFHCSRICFGGLHLF